MAYTIERLRLSHLQVPLREVGIHATAERVVQRDVILVIVDTDDGLTGIGECCPPPGDAAAVDACWSALAEIIAPPLVGARLQSLDDIEPLLKHAQTAPPPARAGIETAAWDIVGQIHDASLASLLGASDARIAVGVEPSVGFGLQATVVDLLRAIEPHHDEGIRAFNLAIAPGSDVDFIAAVARHFPRCTLGINCGGRFTHQHHETFRRIDDLDPAWIEFPYPSEHRDALPELQDSLVTPICLDATDSAAIEQGACRMARLHIQAVGGLGPARALHNDLDRRGITCRVDTTPELGIGLAQAIAFAALPNCKDPSGLAPAARWFLDDIVKPRIELESSAPARFRVSTRAGVGHMLDWPRVHQHQVREHSATT